MRTILFLILFLLQILPAKAFLFTVPTGDKVTQRIGLYSQEELDPQNIQVLVWNVYKGKEDGWSSDFHSLARDKDLVLLQEMYLNPHMQHAFFELPDIGFDTATSFIYDYNGLRTGVATGSKTQPKRLIWRHSPSSEPVTGTPKVGLITTYPLEDHNKDLLVVNVHGINFVRTKYLKQQLQDLAKQIKDFQGPMIMAGDFNTWTPGKVAALYQVTENLRLNEVEFERDERKQAFGFYLDYVFTRGLGTYKSQTHGDIETSDHAAMSAQFHVKEEKLPNLLSAKEKSDSKEEVQKL